MQSKPNANAKNSLILCQNCPNTLKELYDPQKVLHNVPYDENCDLEYWDETTCNRSSLPFVKIDVAESTIPGDKGQIKFRIECMIALSHFP